MLFFQIVRQIVQPPIETVVLPSDQFDISFAEGVLGCVILILLTARRFVDSNVEPFPGRKLRVLEKRLRKADAVNCLTFLIHLHMGQIANGDEQIFHSNQSTAFSITWDAILLFDFPACARRIFNDGTASTNQSNASVR